MCVSSSKQLSICTWPVFCHFKWISSFNIKFSSIISFWSTTTKTLNSTKQRDTKCTQSFSQWAGHSKDNRLFRNELGLASISIWSRSDCEKYSAIMCDQKHEWSRSPRPSAAVQTRPTTTVLQPIPWVQTQRYCQTVDANKLLGGGEGIRGEGCSSKSAGVVWWDAVGGVHSAQCQTTTAAGR